MLPEEEKIIVEEIKSNGQTVTEEKSLTDTVYTLKDEVQELRQDKMKKSLEEKQRAREDLEKLVRRSGGSRRSWGLICSLVTTRELAIR